MQEKNIALYLRSSVEQERAKRSASNLDESDTIANQRKMLKAYAVRKGLADHNIIEYVDDGHSGTNFKRPAFERLIKDADNGKIQAIIVKDLSRLGRDYIGVGEYIETVFPSKGIRIISVNDRWDSDEHPGQTMCLDTSFRTILYDMYSRDLSRKRKTSNAVRNKQGIYSANLPPYGYQKDPADKHSLVIDEKEALVVRRIYKEYLTGTSIKEIAKTLTAEGVPSPSERNYEGGQFRRYSKAWTTRIVKLILKREEYTGTIILNRLDHVYGEGRSALRDRSEWYFFPDRHEAIISKEDYEAVQKKLGSHTCKKKSLENEWCPVICGHCGRRLYQTTTFEKTMRCLKHDTDPDAECGDIRIRRNVLEKCVSEMIRQQSKIFVEWAEVQITSPDGIKGLERQKQNLVRQQKKIKNSRLQLYEMYKEGEVSKETFLARKAETIEAEEALLIEEQNVEIEIADAKSKAVDIAEAIGEMKRYGELRKIGTEVVKNLIREIRVFNDGRVSLAWNFQDEFPKSFKCNQDIDTGAAERVDNVKAFVYSSDLKLMKNENRGKKNRGLALGYCVDALGLSGSEIRCFYDSRDEQELFYRREYMRMMSAAKTGRYDAIVIKDFGDLYLSKSELHDLLYWIIPRMPCRFISIADGYDSIAESGTSDPDRIYERYKGIRRGDLLKYHAQERNTGQRVAEQPANPKCTLLYGYYNDENGCYADKEILKAVKSMYWDILEGKKPGEIFRELNENNVPTPFVFYRNHGMKVSREKKHEWSLEKMDCILKNRKYMTECKYREQCEKQGRHCERRPIITKKDFEKANSAYRYRKTR